MIAPGVPRGASREEVLKAYQKFMRPEKAEVYTNEWMRQTGGRGDAASTAKALAVTVDPVSTSTDPDPVVSSELAAQDVDPETGKAWRYTLGPVYMPGLVDAHGDSIDSDTLESAIHNYVRSGDRKIRLQHQPGTVAGEWVGLLVWPWEVTVPIIEDGIVSQHTFPAGTPFMGVVWTEEVWPLIESGAIRGYSLGGMAEFVVMLDEEAVEKFNHSHGEGGRFTSEGDSFNAAASTLGVNPGQNRDDYHMIHQAPTHDFGGASLDTSIGQMYPDDLGSLPLHTAMRYYGGGGTEFAADEMHSINTMRSATKWRNDGAKGDVPKVTVYRAMPKSVPVNKFNNGDWVTPSLKYAHLHADGPLFGVQGGTKIISDTVPVTHLYTDANSLLEWGYDSSVGTTKSKWSKIMQSIANVVRSKEGKDVQKYNHAHGEGGRFTSSSGGNEAGMHGAGNSGTGNSGSTGGTGGATSGGFHSVASLRTAAMKAPTGAEGDQARQDLHDALAKDQPAILHGVDAKGAVKLTHKTGGFTYNPNTGEAPTLGFSVSPYPEKSLAVETKSMNDSAIRDQITGYAAKNRDALAVPGQYMGGWLDKGADGKGGSLYLDVSIVTQSASEARSIGAAHDQIAYYDFQTGESPIIDRNNHSGRDDNGNA